MFVLNAASGLFVVVYFGFAGCRCCLYGCSMVGFGVNVILGLVVVLWFRITC